MVKLCLRSLPADKLNLQGGGEGVRTQEHQWSQCDELLSELTCSQQNFNLFTPGKSVIGFSMGRRWRQ